MSDPALLLPGDTLVVPVGLGGWEVFGHIPPGTAGEPVVDLGDRAHLIARAVPVLRIHPATVASWPACAARDALLRLALTLEPPEEAGEIRDWLRELAEMPSAPEWLCDAAAALAADRGMKIDHRPGWGLTVRGMRRVWKYEAQGAALTSEDDSSSATVEVALDAHLLGLEDWALRFAHGAGLPQPLVEDVALAGRLHDLGKADPRFQGLLQGGSYWAAQAAGALLAKSSGLPMGRSEYRRACRETGYPAGGRHELASVSLVESSPALVALAHDPDLVLHLIASHHGRCRPFAPVVNDRAPLTVTATALGNRLTASSATLLERLDSGVPERFWRLLRRYGWWGLAWIEALLRLADHRCSEQEQEERAKSPAETDGPMEAVR